MLVTSHRLSSLIIFSLFSLLLWFLWHDFTLIFLLPLSSLLRPLDSSLYYIVSYPGFCSLLSISVLDHFIWFHADESYSYTTIAGLFLETQSCIFYHLFNKSVWISHRQLNPNSPKLNSSSNLFTNLIPSFRESHHLTSKNTGLKVKPNFSVSFSNSVDFMSQESLGSVLSAIPPLLQPWVRFTSFPPECLEQPPSSSSILADTPDPDTQPQTCIPKLPPR